jgi:hypothetical protein
MVVSSIGITVINAHMLRVKYNGKINNTDVSAAPLFDGDTSDHGPTRAEEMNRIIKHQLAAS